MIRLAGLRLPLPASLVTHLGQRPERVAMPARVRRLIEAQEERSERLIGWAQLGVVLTFATLYFVAPKPADAGATMFEPVPLVLAPYFAFTLLRLWLTHRGFLPGWFLVLSMLVDVAMLFALIWTFHIDYGQPAAFYLKVPTFLYVFVFIAIRALRFDPRFVLSMGAFAAIGWTVMVAYAVVVGGEMVVTRSFVEYLTGPYVLIGAEFDKIATLAVVTGVLSFAVWRARSTLLVAMREEAAGRDLRRFLSEGVADAVADAEIPVAAGRAEARDAAIVMLDIRGFTGFSTDRDPEAVVAMLTSFHARAIPIIQAHGGVVDKFLGDGVMATFGAVAASATPARDGFAALEAVLLEAAHWPEGRAAGLVVNGAVTVGTVVFAAIGHGNRLEYTVIGEAVNLAAKLEKHNKIAGTTALAPAAAFERARDEGFQPRRAPTPLEGQRVTGLAGPVALVAFAG